MVKQGFFNVRRFTESADVKSLLSTGSALYS
jgi:hypothetical protein